MYNAHAVCMIDTIWAVHAATSITFFLEKIMQVQHDVVTIQICSYIGGKTTVKITAYNLILTYEVVCCGWLETECTVEVC